jgi:exonuclease III
VNRAALVHTIIADNSIDLLALQESWIDADDPNAIQSDIAPTGYGIIHVHRLSSKDSHRRSRGVVVNRLNRGGGRAIVYRQELNAKAHRLQPVTKPSTFEYELAAVKTNSSTNIFNIYRPPSPWIPSQTFFDELADLVSVLLTSSSQAVVVCGDLNCHGDDPHSTDKRLAAVFDSLNKKQYVNLPTRDDHLLDILACSDDNLTHDVIVDDSVNVSDHRLIKALFRVSKR